VISVVSGDDISKLTRKRAESDSTLKYILEILEHTVDNIPAKYNINIRVDRSDFTNAELLSTSVNFLKFISSFFVSLVSILSISSDRTISVTLSPAKKNGYVLSSFKTRLEHTKLNVKNSSDFSKLNAIFPNEALNISVFAILSRFVNSDITYSITSTPNGSEFVLNTCHPRVITNIMLLRSKKNHDALIKSLKSSDIKDSQS